MLAVGRSSIPLSRASAARRSRWAAAIAVLCALAWLAVAPSSSQAGTWNIYPTITNATGSTAANCASAGDQGCIFLESSGLVDGDWTPPSGLPAGGLRQLPANGGANVDRPNFDAPHLAEGADGYFVYAMPDGSEFSLAAEDDQGVTDLTNEAYAGCGAKPGQGPVAYTCLAAYPAGTNGDPSSSDFKPSFTFYPNVGMTAPFTAAGQVCSTTTGSALCGAGLQCAPVNPKITGGIACYNQAPAPGTGQWSPTDPNNPMWLNFVNTGDSPVTMANLNTIPLIPGGGPGPNDTLACTMQNKGDSCAFMTSGGCSQWKPPHCGSDAISMTTLNGWSEGSVMVMQQASVPKVMADDLGGQLNAEIESIIWHEFSSVHQPSAPTSGAISGQPQITSLRASTVATGAGARAASKGKPAKAKAKPAVQVSYRNTRAARSVLTVARERPGVRRGGRCVAPRRKTGTSGKRCTRWVDLPGVGTKTSTHNVWTPRGDRPCPATAKRGPKNGGRCQQRNALRGHQQHRDRAGANRVAITRVGGKRLAAGRYRVTVSSLAGTAKGRPAATTFRIRSGS